MVSGGKYFFNFTDTNDGTPLPSQTMSPTTSPLTSPLNAKKKIIVVNKKSRNNLKRHSVDISSS
jgi:hypothetical protein